MAKTNEDTTSTDSPESLSVDDGADKLLSFPDHGSDTEDAESQAAADQESDETDDGKQESDETDDSEQSDESDDSDQESDDADESDDEDDAEGSEAPELHQLRANGEDVEVTLEELKAGYSRTANYTRDKQAVADDRRAVEAEKVAVGVQRDQYVKGLEIIEKNLMEVPEPDWEKVRTETPNDFAAIHADWHLKQDSLKKVQAERERVDAERVTETTSRRAAYIAEQKELLVNVMPDFQDKKKGPVLRSKLYEYAEEQGYTKVEMDALVDHRIIVTLDKARRYDESRKRVKEVKTDKKREKLPTVKPGARVARGTQRSSVQKKAQERLAKSGSIQDATTALMDLEDD